MYFVICVCGSMCVCVCACQWCALQWFGSGLTFPALTSCLSSSPLLVNGRKPWRDTVAPATQTCLFVSISEELSSILVTDTRTHKCTHAQFFSPYYSFSMWNDTVTVKCRLSDLICSDFMINLIEQLKKILIFSPSTVFTEYLQNVLVLFNFIWNIVPCKLQ